MNSRTRTSTNAIAKKALVLLVTTLMVMTSLPFSAFAGNDFNYDNISDEKAKFLNKEKPSNPAELGDDPTTTEEANAQIKNVDMPRIFDIRAEYKARKDDALVHLFQPYEATVGDDEYTYKDSKGNTHNVISEEEKNKINKRVDLPEIDGYTKPTEATNFDYDYIKNKGLSGKQKDNRFAFFYPYIYTAQEGEIKVKHIFQNLYDKNEYGFKDGEKEDIYTTANGFIGQEITVSPLSEKERRGYVPEKTVIKTRVPDDIADYVIEYRYNRDSFNVSYDMDGGSPIPSQTLYYGQTIPNLNVKPKKIGGIFVGWKSDTDLNYKDENGNIKTIHKDTKFDMKDFKDGIKEAMPAKDIKFTALWKDEPKANYTIQFWTEKADSVGYDYIGAKVVKDADTGSRPDLSLMMPSGIKFPEIEKSLTEDAKVNELNKYFVRNEKKINKENTETVKQDDGTNVLLTKKVQPDGRTTYNIYYDRQTYTMLFEKFCIDEPEAGFPAKEAKMVLPDGTKYDSTKDVNNPYKFKAKFGERMKKWPNDMWLIGEGGIDFEPNQSFIGWQLNSENNGNLDQSLYLDTPPYWLTSKDFIDRDFTELDPAVTPATHSTSTGEKLPERTISLGPCSSAEYQFAIYYMEYLFEGFDGALHYNPDMSYTKIDTSGPYLYPSPGIVGFKPKYEGIKPVDDALESPEKKKGYTEDLSKLTFEEIGKELDKTEEKRKNSEKSFFEPIAEKGINGVPFKDIDKYRFAFTYEREKYKIYLDTDSSDINEQSELAKKKLASGKDATVSDVYYDIPLRKLNLDEKYKLTEADRPANVPEDFVFKGWAMDPQGTKLIKDTVKKSEELEAKIAGKYEELAKNSKDKDKKFKIQNEIKELKAKLADADANMPNYDIVLYAKWGEPDKTFKVKFDPNQGNLSDIDPMDIVTFKDGELIKTSADKTVYQLPEKLPNEGDVQVFNVKSRTKIKQPKGPKRKGYDFLGWELIRHKNDGSVDTSYMDKYGVPELYAFDNEVVEDAYLKAIWVKNDLLDIPVKHILLDENFNEKKDALPDSTVPSKRVGEYAEAVAKYQGEDYLTIPEAEWDKLAEKSTAYKEYLDKTKRTNRYSQVLKVEPEKIKKNGALVDNPKAENNYFMFFYREFTKRHYKVNYLSTTEEDADKLPGIGKKPGDSFKIIDTEEVTSGSTDYDAVNYREIPGWKIISTPQRQLFYYLNDDGEMIGINGVKSNEVNFYYKDIRVIKRKTPDAKTPDGYHRVVFKADRDGSFGKDADGNPIKEVIYDVIDGLEFRNIMVPPEQNEDGTLKAPVITPDPNAKFIGWDDSRLLDENTVIRKDYTFTAKFKPLKDIIEVGGGGEDIQDYFVDVYVDTTDKADGDINDNQFTGNKKLHFKVNPEKKVEIPVSEPKGAVAKDKDGKPITNAYGVKQKWQFMKWQVEGKDKTWSKGSKIEDKFTEKVTTIVAKYNLNVTPIEPIPNPAPIYTYESAKDDQGGWTNNFIPTKDKYDEALKEVKKLDGYKSYKILTTDDDLYKMLKEDGQPVADNQPRTVKVKAEVSFENGRKTIVNIPVKVFKNIYRSLNDEDKPDVVKNNEELKNFVKVTVNPTKLAKDQTKKVYYVNPDAKVIIPENDPTPTENHTFEGWYYIDKTKVTTDNPKGKVEIDLTKRHQIPEAVEIIASYSTPITPIVPLEPKADKIIKNVGDSLTVDDYLDAITPPKDDNGKELRTIKTVKIVNPKDKRVTTEVPGGPYKEKIEVIYEDGATFEIEVDVIVRPDYVEQKGNDKPEVPDNYVKVVFKPTDKAVDSTEAIYWVNPEKEVKLPVTKPEGKKAVVVDGVKTDYTFKAWHAEADDKTFDVAAKHQFKQDTSFVAKYKKTIDAGIITPIPDIKSKGLTVSESLKDGDKWINNFIPSEETLKNAIKITTPDGKVQALPEGAKVEFGDGEIGEWKKYDNLEAILYDKLKEKDDGNKPSREEKIKALITVDGWSKIVELPIKVNKNIYEAKTLQGAPDYVPDGYVKVELNPTKDAQDSQKTYYYVNPKAMVKIPGNDPTPVEGKVFAGWVLKAGDKDKVSYNLANRHKFTDESNVIKATFVSDIVEQEGDDKPNVPDTFIKVTVDYTEKAKLDNGAKEKRIFWVNPKAEVKLPVENPVGKSDDAKKITWKFKYWQLDKAGGKKYNTDIVDTFSKEVTIKAHYFVEPKSLLPAVKTIEEKVVPKDGDISAKDFVKNLYDDNDPTNKDNLPPGSKITFVDPVDTSKVGEQTVKIKVVYPNGEETIVERKIFVTEDVVPQTGDDKPKVPDSYVKVVVDYTNKAKLADGEKIKQTFWVNPDKEVKILDSDPVAIENWTFEKWMVGKEDISLTEGNRFKEPVTNVKAQYSYKPVEIQPLEPNPDKVQTYVGKKPEKDDYIKKLNPPAGKTIKDIEIIEEPDVTKPGETKAKIKVIYDDGSEYGTPENPILVDVVIKNNIYPADTDGNKTSDTPDNYVRVIVDPTSNAKDAQKKYYYVNPEANVKLELTDPEAIEHYNFVRWTIDDTGFEADKEHKFTEETTITAEYYQDPIVTFLQIFSDNSVKKTEKMFVKRGDKLNEADLPAVGTKDGDWVFKGWFANEELTEKFDFETIIEDDTTIFGVWNKVPTIKVKDTTIVKGSDFDLKSLVQNAEDLEDGDLINKVEIISVGGFDKDKVGNYKIVFRVTDKDGATSEATAEVTVMKGCTPCANVNGNGSGNGNGNGNGSAHYGRNSTPRTGDNMNDAYVYLMGLYIAGMLAYFIKKRNS